jgi:hypothetical protein
MPRRPATVTQADVARALRAAKQTGAGAVEVRRDGSIVIHLAPPSPSVPEVNETNRDIIL